MVDDIVVTSKQEDKQTLLDNLKDVSESIEPIDFQINGIYRER